MKKIWQIWKYSLGSFSDDKTAPYDNYVASIRTVIFVSYMVTNVAIIANAVRHWNDNDRNSIQDGRNNSGHLAQSISTTKGLETTSKITH